MTKKAFENLELLTSEVLTDTFPKKVTDTHDSRVTIWLQFLKKSIESDYDEDGLALFRDSQQGKLELQVLRTEVEGEFKIEVTADESRGCYGAVTVRAKCNLKLPPKTA